MFVGQACVIASELWGRGRGRGTYDYRVFDCYVTVNYSDRRSLGAYSSSGARGRDYDKYSTINYTGHVSCGNGNVQRIHYLLLLLVLSIFLGARSDEIHMLHTRCIDGHSSWREMAKAKISCTADLK